MSKFRVLITRPAHQAEHLQQAIERLGGEAILFPTIEIVPIKATQPVVAALKNFKNLHKVIFVSANAVYPVMPHWPKPHFFPQVFAIGSGTAKALAEFSISAIIPNPAEFKSEGLLALPDLQNVKGENILIFSGENSRSVLKENLEKRGAAVQQIAVYARKRPSTKLSSAQKANLHCIISTSQESLENLWLMLNEAERAWLLNQQLLVISEKMVTVAKKLGFVRSPWLAENASDEAIVAVITPGSLALQCE